MRSRLAAIALGVVLGFAAQAQAQTAPAPSGSEQVLLTRKQVFEIPSFTTRSGRTLKNVKVGWESYGTLNADKSNAILICHFFSGTSHAAGKYAANEAETGYWDGIIGPGKAIDTNKYFVLSADTLANLNAYDPKVVTTGPATVNVETGKPYGMEFPVVTIRDFVEVQKKLVESLGIKRLHAVAGPSMGALQTYEWAVSYPEMVARAMPVIGAAEADAYLIGWLDIWAAPIRVDPKWSGGNYYGKASPDEGLAQALKIVTMQAQHWMWANKTFGRAWAKDGVDPAASMANRFKIQSALDAAVAARAKLADANHFLYLVKANQLFVAGGGPLNETLKRIKAPVLMISQLRDQVFHGDGIKATADALKAAGVSLQQVFVSGERGHLDGVVSIKQAEGPIRAFIDR